MAAAEIASVSVEQVLQVHQLFLAPTGDHQKRREADRWLDNFQKTAVAWGIADTLIRTDIYPMPTRIFAAQTFRQKIEYDLDQLDAAARSSLRASLIDLLHKFRAGPKSMIIQLSVALADLAIQMPEWEDPVLQLVESFGKDPEMVGALLQFLGALPEELTSNKKIKMERDDWMSRSDSLLKRNGPHVFALLLHYLQIADQNPDIQESIFGCLRSWLRAREIDVEMLMSSPIIDYTFRAMHQEALFEAAADVLIEIIIQSGKKPVNIDLIQTLYHRLPPLRSMMDENEDDVEQMRSLCRIFAEAGEAWLDLIVANPAAFRIVVDGLLKCAANPDLDVVRITFQFWFLLADEILLPAFQSQRAQFAPVYGQVIDTIIKHLQYPEDLATMTAQERDEFRDFRHVMGDVLKDCVRVLGEEAALSRPYAVLSNCITNGGVPGVGVFDISVPWPQIEAPLFALRAMGREVSVEESTVLPKIMAMLPQLPNHPKIKYAAILVIGRYAEWTNAHPEFIAYQLTYISSGFAEAEEESMAAAAMSLKFLCQFCGPRIVNYLDQLHPFYLQTTKTMNRDDALELTEAIAHVVHAVPLEGLLETMRNFCLPIAQRLHEIAIAPIPTVETEHVAIVKEAAGLMARFAVFVRVVRPQIPHGSSHPCVSVLQDVWPVLDNVVSVFSSADRIIYAFSRVCVASMESYRHYLTDLLSPIMTKVVALYEQTKESCLLWVAKKCVSVYGDDEGPQGAVMFAMVERLTQTTFESLQQMKSLDSNPDIVEDYFALLTELMDVCPTLFCQSSLLPSAFQCAVACLGMEHREALLSVLLFLRDLFKCASPFHRDHPIPQVVAEPLVDVMKKNASVFLGALFEGLVMTFPMDKDVISDVATIIKCMMDAVPELTMAGVEAIITGFSEQQLSASGKETFMRKFASATEQQEAMRLSGVLQDFAAAYRRRNLISSRGQRA
ncbi:Nuclear import receptor [Borealophlyctis nickersoniae]|nr:Nuclear import receptor [Borealophlyctis nickersoniae]